MPKFTVIIPARGGSKGIPYKNLQPVGGVPLVRIAIIQAFQIFKGHDIDLKVSSEDDEILKEAGVYGAFRPDNLAGDTVGTLPVLKYHMKNGAEYGCLMQPTHPFRDVKECRAMVEGFLSSGEDSAALVSQNDSFFWRAPGRSFNRGEYRKRRQDMPSLQEETGAFYLFKRDRLMQEKDWMFKSCAFYPAAWAGIDIHTEDDLKIANKLWSIEWLS